jgi:hypothetical protein
MFVGHYAAGLAAKAIEPRIPLWACLLAVQLVDVAWALLVLAGVERFRLDPSLPSNPLVLEHMPYTHSLVATGVWAGFAALAARRAFAWAAPRAAAVLGLAVASHWLLDLVVHRPDLTLWGAEPKLGLSLWNHTGLALALELGLLGAGAWACLRPGGPLEAQRVRLAVLVAALAALQLASLGPLLPPPVPVLAASLLGVFVLVPLAGAWVEGRYASSPPSATNSLPVQ